MYENKNLPDLPLFRLEIFIDELMTTETYTKLVFTQRGGVNGSAVATALFLQL